MNGESNLKKEEGGRARNTAKYQLHQKCHKDFMSPFVGKVSALPEGRRKYYEVIYEDGDVEDLTARQLQKCIAYYNAQSPDKSKTPVKKKSHKCAKYEVSIGTKLMKDFHRTFEGEVIRLPTSPRATYRIKFLSDGVEINVTTEELDELVKNKEDFDRSVEKSKFSDEFESLQVDELEDVPLSKRFKIEDDMITGRDLNCDVAAVANGASQEPVETDDNSSTSQESAVEADDGINHREIDNWDDDVKVESDTSTGPSHVKLDLLAV